MGKFKQAAGTAALRTGNTIATPLRRGGEIVNAGANIPRQLYSSVKNTKEVQMQTLNTLMHNFLNFSKVKGKRYEKMVKVPINLASAVTRRPLMIGGASMLSSLNQGVRQPFKKLLYTPGKMFKGMRNATRIFSKKKGFDFATYDTHETTGNTRINQIREKGIGFFGKGGSSAPSEQPKAEKPKKEATVPQSGEKKKEKPAEKPKENLNDESDLFQKKIAEKDDAFLDKELAERGYGPGEKIGTEPKSESKKPDKPAPTNPQKSSEKSSDNPAPKSIDEIKEKNKKEAEAKDKAEQDKRQRKNLDPKFKVQYEKEFKKMLNNKPTKEGVLERGKKNKKGETVEEIVETIKKENYPEFAGYIETEILKTTNN